MSLKRNSRSSTNKTLTIKRFPYDEVLGTKTISGTSYSFYPREWGGLNNYYLKEVPAPSYGHVGFNANSTIVIKCELAADATGPLFGVTGKARIECDGTKIKWYNDSNTAVHTVAISTGIHNIGIYSDNGKMKPYYDGKVTDTGDAKAMSTNVYEKDFYPCALTTDAIDGTQTGVLLTSSSETYAIKIYEIAGTFIRDLVSNVKFQFMHFYVCSSGQNGTHPALYETRSDVAHLFNRGTTSGATADGCGPNVTYGVQLHDLQEAFGVGNRQLLAILVKDNGADRGVGDAAQYHAGWLDPAAGLDESQYADTAETIVLGNKTFNSAFYLQAYPNGCPNGATITNPHDYTDYENGELIRGRQPMWSLWNDAINSFRYVERIMVGANYTYRMRINIFKDVYGNHISTKDNPDMLGVFDGYSTSMSAIHAPHIEVTGNTEIPTYNSVAYVKKESHRYCKDTDLASSVYDNNTGLMDGTVKAVIGNLPYWNLTRAQQEELAPEFWGIYGFVVRGSYQTSLETWKDMFRLVKGEEQALSSETDSTTKTRYQSTGETANLALTAFSNCVRVLADHTGYLGIYYRMGLLNGPASGYTIDQQLVDCGRLVPTIKSSVSAIQNYSKLLLLGPSGFGGTITYNDNAYELWISQYTSDFTNQAIRLPDVYSADEYNAVGFRFALYDSSTNPLTLYGTTNNNPDKSKPLFVAYAEYVRMADVATIQICDGTSYTADTKYDLLYQIYYGNDDKTMYFARQGLKCCHYVDNLYNKAEIASYPTQNDFPKYDVIYCATKDIYSDIYAYDKLFFIYLNNAYINSDGGIEEITSISQIESYYKIYYNTTDGKFYRLTRPRGASGSTAVELTIQYYDNKSSFPELGDYYKDESTGNIYMRYYFSDRYAPIQMTVNTYSNKSGFPASGDTGTYLYYDQSTKTYYDYGRLKTVDGNTWHKSLHEDETESVSTLPTTGQTYIIYYLTSDNKFYRWSTGNGKYYEISPWYDRGEVIEKRAMFAECFALGQDVGPWPTQSDYTVKGEDYKYYRKNQGERTISAFSTGDTGFYKFSVALFYNYDFTQGDNSISPQSAYNNEYGGNAKYMINGEPFDHPKTINIRVYEKANAPHAWCVGSNAFMCDKVENWSFRVGQVSNRYYSYYLLNDAYLIDNGYKDVVRAYMGLFYQTNLSSYTYNEMECTKANFRPFKLKLQKQSATKPYVNNNGTYTKDLTSNITDVFEVDINPSSGMWSGNTLTLRSSTSGYSALGDYEITIKAEEKYGDFRMYAGGTVKDGEFDAAAYSLFITYDGQDLSIPEKGATYLLNISSI